MKKKILMLSLIFVCLFSVFTLTGCGNKDNTPPTLTGTQATFKDFTKIDDTTYSIKVANDTETFNFSNSVAVAKDCKWKLTADIYGIVDIPSKIGTLDVGDNTYYILVTDKEENVKMYTLQVRRKLIYTVSFDTNGGTIIDSIQVEEDSLLPNSLTIPTKEDYVFDKWDYDLDSPITKNTKLTASYKLKEYNITYCLNDGINNLNNPTKFTIEDYDVELLNPTLLDAEFDGWYLDSSFANKIISLNNLHNDIVVYAKWLTTTEGIIFEEWNDCVVVKSYEGSEKNVYITGSYQGKPIKEIWYDAFLYSNIESVRIPNTVEKIGSSAFRYCSSLTDITFQENSKLKEIDWYAFDNSVNLTNINIPKSIEKIGEKAFNCCDKLNLVTYNSSKYLCDGTDYTVLMKGGGTTTHIASTTKVIYDEAFKDCGYSSYFEITIPSSVTYIGDKAFENSLFQISISTNSKLKYIGKYAFKDAKLYTFHIPATLEIIDSYGLSGCHITKVTFEARDNELNLLIKEFGINCTYLSDLYIPNYLESIGTNTFEGSGSNLTVYYECTENECRTPVISGNQVYNISYTEYLQLISD